MYELFPSYPSLFWNVCTTLPMILVLNMEKNQSMHLWNQMLIWLIFRPYSSKAIKRYGLKYFQFPLPAKNQIESVQNADHKRLQRNKSGFYKIVETFFPNIFTKSPVHTNLFFVQYLIFFSPSLEGQVGQSVGHQFVTRGLGSFDLVSFVTWTSSLKMEKAKYIRLK